MRIRRFIEADAGAVSALIRKTLQVSNSRDYSPAVIDELIQRHTVQYVLERAEWTHFYVAEENGTVIGCGAVGPYWDKTDESALFSLFVLPEYQRRGAGRRIVEALEKDAYALRARRIELAASITALPFYRKLGYEYKNGKAVLDKECLYRMEKYRTQTIVTQESDPDRKRKIAREILEDLSDWFEIVETREGYIRDSGSQVFFKVEMNGEAAGFLCVNETGKATLELAVMGVKKTFHRRGIGRKLIKAAKEYAAGAGYEFLQVKTVRMGCYEDYDATNRFYLSVGFKEFEVMPDLWGEENPCQIYVMTVKKQGNLSDLISGRHSYRGKYKPDRIPRKDLVTIMEAGLAAPSGCNKQTTSLIAVDDPDVLEKLHAVIDPPVGESAPAMICVLTQRVNAYRDRCFSVQDYSAAIENMLLMIVSLGYQSCWYEGHITDEDRIGDQMARILNVPDDYDLVCMLPVGIPESEPVLPRKKSFEERAWFNAFRPENR